MINFDINGACVEFDDKMDNYNSIRKTFSSYAEISVISYESLCIGSISSIKQLSEKGYQIAEGIIDDIIRKSIECIVSYGVITVDFETFKNTYCSKYLDFKRIFNNINKELLIPNKNKKNSPRFYDIKPTITKLSKYLYDDCFNIHLGVIDALTDNGVCSVNNYLTEDNVKKANALFNNYRDGFITKPDECRVVKQIITLNPYRKDVYEFIIQEDGDFSQEVERLTEYLGYDIKPYKATLMDIYIKELLEEENSEIEIAKEKLKKYSKYIGCRDDSVYLERIDSIYSFENA